MEELYTVEYEYIWFIDDILYEHKIIKLLDKKKEDAYKIAKSIEDQYNDRETKLLYLRVYKQ